MYKITLTFCKDRSKSTVFFSKTVLGVAFYNFKIIKAAYATLPKQAKILLEDTLDPEVTLAKFTLNLETFDFFLVRLEDISDNQIPSNSALE